MTVQGEPWNATWTVVRGAAAVGFIVCLWLETFCNLPALCEPLALAVFWLALL